MGSITGNFESVAHSVGDILLGDNEFETGVLTVAANTTVTEGALLKRASDGKFAVITDISTEVPVAIFIGESIANSTGNAKTYELRALISGRVDAGKCHIGSDALTAADKDLLRAHSIIALDVAE